MATSNKVVNPIDPDFHGYLDPDFIEYYNTRLAIRPATDQVVFADVRKNPERFRGNWCRDFSDQPRVTTFEISSEDGTKFKARSYHPDPERYGPGPYAVHINYHGGGFCFGDLTEDAQWCMLMCARVGIIIVDVDYRLCPESRYGKGIEDGWAALKWVYTHSKELNSRPGSISIGGVSAGAFMSCVYQHMARDAGLKLKLAILCVPTAQSRTTFNQPEDSGFLSYIENAKAPCLNWGRLMYLRDVVGDRSKVPKLWSEPLHEENFAGICDTFIATAGADPVRDEGEAYGLKLVKAGCRATFRRYTGVPHTFQHMGELEKTKLYNEDTCLALKSAHDPSDVHK
ncbi:Alpha/Beta hydrolase protein [Talaromyces proteolyticus]|uniref:Alpha/Beta hydrolase protein n=1 Tax=Talaromyces proteolyticus TaxID=1131652 RepID=A0AAD4PW10_9EURO|nr:Alpha/Beta hydrolase protein [Talaromyces proteolyticus]KAH8691387.1 Alpha/Beta hydrolase protein [Talaromyces proteolyticus]